MPQPGERYRKGRYEFRIHHVDHAEVYFARWPAGARRSAGLASLFRADLATWEAEMGGELPLAKAAAGR